jgi:hypothetical protein
MLEARVADGDPKLVEIIEQAIAQAEDALGEIDDSNGSVMPAIMQLREVHERACNNLTPDPVALAERLFRFQTTGDWDTFHSVLPSYERALGQSGLKRYRELVDAAWKRVPALGPETSRTHFDSDRYRVEHAMEELVALSGDVDALVAVKARNLSSPQAFLELAGIVKHHGRYDEGLAWAEKGIAAFGSERLDDLVKFSIDEHLRRGDEQAVALYKKLLPHVVTAGTRGAQYGEAFEIVKAIQELRAAQKQDALFRQELAELRTTWKAKRNFMKLLATLG